MRDEEEKITYGEAKGIVHQFVSLSLFSFGLGIGTPVALFLVDPQYLGSALVGAVGTLSVAVGFLALRSGAILQRLNDRIQQLEARGGPGTPSSAGPGAAPDAARHSDAGSS